MNKLKIFRPSGLVKASVHPLPGQNEHGSLGRQKNRQKRWKEKTDSLIAWVKEQNADTIGYLTFEEEQNIRDKVDRVLKGNLVAKKGVLSTVGLELTKKDRKRLGREIEEVSKYPGIDLFEREFKAQFAIGKIIESFGSDRQENGRRQWTSSELLGSLTVLMMVLHGVADKDMAIMFSLAAVHDAYAIKNVPMVGLPVKGGEQSDNPVLTHKLILSRAVLHLLKELRRRRKKEALQKLIHKKSYAESIERLLKVAGIQCSGGYENGLEELGQHISALREMYIPAYIRELFDGGILSTPISPFEDYVCTTLQYPRHWPGSSLPGDVQVAIDKTFTDIGEEEIGDDEFFSGLSDQIKIVEVIGCNSREDARLTLAEKVMSYLDACRAKYRLTAAQRLLGLFLWYMGLVGIPQSLEDSSKGTLGTLRTYLSKAKQVILHIYGREFDIELDDDRWQKGIKKLRKLGQYDLTTADRLHYFLDCMDAMELMEVPSPSIVYKGLKKVDVPACAQLISLRAYERALEYISCHYPASEAWRHTFALMLMYRGGLRFCEVYETKYNQVVVCDELVDVYVGGRGQSQSKSKAANRWSSLLGDLTEHENRAIEQFLVLKKEEGVCSNSYIYHCADTATRLLDRGRLQRSINTSLKVATGCSNARGHDCRKTNVNHVILNILLVEGGTHRLKQLWSENLLPRMNIPVKWKRGGARHAYFGDAIAARYGHVDFNVTVKNYLVYAPELYQYYWQQVELDKAIRPAMTHLSFGELKTGHERYDFMEKQHGTQGIPSLSPSVITPPDSLKVSRVAEVFPRNVSDVAHILSGRVPADVSYTEARIGQRKAAIVRVNEIAQRLAKDLKYSSHDYASYSPEEWSPRQHFYDTCVPADVICHFVDHLDSSGYGVYAPNGIWCRSYISEEVRDGKYEERLTLDSIEDTETVIDHLKLMGFDACSLVLQVLKGSEFENAAFISGCRVKVATVNRLRKYFFRSLETCAVICISRDTASKIQFSKRFHQLAFSAAVYQLFDEENGGSSE